MRSTGPAVPRGSRRQGIPASRLPAISSRFAGEHLRGAGAVIETRRASRRRARRLSGSPGLRRAAARSARVSPRGRRRGSRRRAARLARLHRERRSASPRPSTNDGRAVPLDRLENEARGSRVAQAQVRPERGEEVGVDRRRHRSPKRKRPPGGGLGQNRWVLWPSARSRIAHGATRPRCERRSSPRAYPRSVPRERRPAGLASWSQVSYCDSRPE